MSPQESGDLQKAQLKGSQPGVPSPKTFDMTLETQGLRDPRALNLGWGLSLRGVPAGPQLCFVTCLGRLFCKSPATPYQT